MNQVQFSSEKYVEEASARKVKSISPHFKPSSSRMTSASGGAPFKKLVTLKLKNTVSAQPVSQTAPVLAPAISLTSKPTQLGDDQSNASSILAYSSNFAAFAKVKLLATRVETLDQNPAIKINSKTSLSDSIDGLTENVPETLILGPRINSLGQPGSQIDKKVKLMGNASTAVTLGSGLKGPVKILKPRNLIQYDSNPDQSPVHSCHKNSDLDRVQEDKPLMGLIPEKCNRWDTSPSEVAKHLNINGRPSNELPSSLQSPEDRSAGGFSRMSAQGGGSRSPESPHMLASPKARPPKANLDNSGHLLELVDPNDGFDLDILSSAEQQSNGSDCENKQEKEKKKKMTKIFDFDHCTITKGRRMVRMSVDCGKVQSEIEKKDELPSPDFENFTDLERPAIITRCASGQGTSNQKRVTSKPIPVNFEKLRLISKELHDNKNQQRVCKTIIKPALEFIEDL